ncbi:ABC-type multidrug transport system, ATPase and permease component [Clostridium sp. ASBs410]|nr:ABC-type multidrug transport system, ATPase and permease component [Clostridium sp. ASBs410]
MFLLWAKGMDIKMKKILPFAAGCRGKLAASVLFAVLSVAGGIIPYFAAAKITYKMIENQYTVPGLGLLVLIALFGYTAKVVFGAVSTELSHQAAYRILVSIRTALTAKLSKVPLGYVTERPSGGLKAVLVDTVEKLEAPFAHLIPEMTANLLVPAAVLIYLFYLDWRLALLSLVTIPLGLLFYIPLMKKYKKYYKKNVEAGNEMSSQAVEYINGIDAIKAFNQSASSYESYAGAVKNSCQSITEFFMVTLLEYTALMTILPSTLLFVLPSALYFYAQGTLELSAMLTCIILSFGLAGPLVQAMKYTDNIASMGTIMNQVAEILKEEEMIRPSMGQDLKDYPIVFENVTFGYQDQEILHGISFEAKPKEMTAIVGPSGSGKSTIAKLIAGFWDVNGGRITLGGVDVRRLPLQQVSSIISYVSQDNFLFHLSIRDNIRIGKPGASDGEIVEAAKKASCHEFIQSLEQGYDTLVGEGGGQLSGGERQRISIARAILKNSPVILLDEATAYTDSENEAVIQQSVSRLVRGKTLIVIAHRLSTISSADRIIVVNDGRIDSQGTHEELLAGSTMYHSMWSAHIGSRDIDPEERR